MTIRALGENDTESFRALRLRALKEYPEAFSSSYETNAEYPLSTFAQRLRGLDEAAGRFVLGAYVDGILVGTVGLSRGDSPKTQHRGFIWGVYVAKEQQGQGIGRHLMVEAIARARNVPGLAIVVLAVVTANDAARKLYVSLGFQTYGIERRAMLVAGKYLDEELMALDVDVDP